jgi:hypothetical protein
MPAPTPDKPIPSCCPWDYPPNTMLEDVKILEANLAQPGAIEFLFVAVIEDNRPGLVEAVIGALNQWGQATYGGGS